jgi:hypothetical protein
VDSFFHHFMRGVLKEEKFKEFMSFNQVMEALFVLFHIDLSTKIQFASHVNQLLMDSQEQLDDLKNEHPKDFKDEEEEESKASDNGTRSGEISGPLNIIGKFQNLMK